MTLKDSNASFSLQNNSTAINSNGVGAMLSDENSALNFKNGQSLRNALNEHLDRSLNISLNENK